MRTPILKKGDKLTCPVCKKVFVASDETCCIRHGDFVCSWNCFTYDIKRPKEKNQNINELAAIMSPKKEIKKEETPSKKRGRPKKTSVVVEKPQPEVKKRGRPRKSK